MPNTTELCTFEADGVWCGKPRYSRDLCTAHYRQQSAGRPLKPLRAYNRQPAECKAEENGERCHGKPHAHGYCKLHANRIARHGTAEAGRTWNPGAICKAEENGKRCTEPVSAKGYCRLHYMRVKRHGILEATRNRNLDAVCKVEKNGERCKSPAKSKGYCQTHYGRVQRTGDPGGVEKIPQAERRKKKSKYDGVLCKAEVDGKRCERPARSKGWCTMHYHRWQRTGDPLGKWGLQPRQSRGYTTTDGYRMSPQRRGKRPILEHRLVMEQIIGRPLHRFEEPHHKNGIRDDNTPGNLELWVKWRRQPNGQRLSDLIDFVAGYYPQEVLAALAARSGSGGY